MGDSRIPEQLLPNADKRHILEIGLKCHVIVGYWDAGVEGRSAEHVAERVRPSDFSWVQRKNLEQTQEYLSFEAKAVETYRYVIYKDTLARLGFEWKSHFIPHSEMWQPLNSNDQITATAFKFRK